MSTVTELPVGAFFNPKITLLRFLNISDGSVVYCKPVIICESSSDAPHVNAIVIACMLVSFSTLPSFVSFSKSVSVGTGAFCASSESI